MDLNDWLAWHHLSKYAGLFAQHAIGLDVLPQLTDQDLKELNIPLGDRKRLLKAVVELSAGGRSGSDALAVDNRTARAGPADRLPSPEGERRQLTVLFCDMVGFTELANRVDPEVLQRIIRSYEDACAVCITRYEGYVFQRLGDGIVAFFGYPLAHEGEAERAIRAALEIIESLSKLDVPDAGHLAVRIGIATGLVVVSSAEKGAVGETMNLAARLQAIATPGSIVVSERVHHLAGGSFDYEDMGQQTLKGIARPTHTYRIVGVSEAASRFEAAHGEAGLTPLVGREQEIGLLLERWALAQDGEGQVVLLSGEPGIGKSRILSALRERLQGQGAQALRFQCSPYYVNSAFWPSIDNFERALKFGRDESPKSKLDKLEAMIVAHYGRPLADVRFIASMLSIPCEERYGVISTTPQKFKDETLRTLVDLTEAAARKQPSVMLFEDVHWADPTTLEVLDLLIDRVKGFPLLIMLTHRPEFQSRWSEQGHVSALNLSKLTRAQSGAMVSRVAGGKALPAALLEQILTKTDGVPLFVEELTKSILESGELKDAGDRYDYSGAAHTVTIPATLRDSLMARLDRFAPVKEIAQIGAAIGREFSHELIAAVAPMSKAALDSALNQLTESGLAFRRGTPPDATYTFKHALVQDAAYDSLLKSKRAQLHARIAEVLEKDFGETVTSEPELLAHHLTQAGLNERAVRYWIQAGQRALSQVAFAEAVGHLTMALSVNDRLPVSLQRDRQELDIRIVLGTAYLFSLGWAAVKAIETLGPARELALRLGENDKLVPILQHIHTHYEMRCEYAAGQEVIDQMHALARSRQDSSALVLALWFDAHRQCAMGNFEGARQATDRVLQAYDIERHGHLVHSFNDPKCDVLLWAGYWCWALGFPDQARKAAEEQLELARGLGHAFNLCWSLTGGTFALLLRGETSLARQWVAEADAIAQENAMAFVRNMSVPMFDGCALIEDGAYEEGYAKVAHGWKVWQGAGGVHVVPFVQHCLGRALIGLQRFDEAEAMLHQALNLIEQTGHRFCEAEVYRVRGELQRKQPVPDLAAAEASFRRALEVARSQQAKGFELRAATSLARLWQGQGKRKKALDLLKPIYNWFTEGFGTRDLEEAKAMLDELS